jgi:hypothetical protein
MASGFAPATKLPSHVLPIHPKRSNILGRIYNPLNLSSNEIRLLTLFPGDSTADINCQLSQHSLEDRLDYEALSYTWGSTEESLTIYVNGFSFQITRNLDHALRHLRAPSGGGARRLWIDAISINQTDIHEREQQVQRMRTIFQSAKQIIAWLGNESEDSNIAMDFLPTVSRGGGLFGYPGAPSRFPQVWCALRALWARPYWGRLWIIQELGSAIVKETTPFMPKYRAVVQCGHKSLPLETLQTAWEFLRNHVDSPYVRGDGEYIPIANLFSILLDFNEKRIKLGDLLGLIVTTNATDPRDKFFGLLGLVSELDRAVLHPDYTKSLGAVCSDVLKSIIQREDSLDILGFDRSNAEPGLPSWAPNIVSPKRSDMQWRTIRQSFLASGTTKPSASFSSHDFYALTLAGKLVDTVIHVTETFVNSRRFEKARHVPERADDLREIHRLVLQKIYWKIEPDCQSLESFYEIWREKLSQVYQELDEIEEGTDSEAVERGRNKATEITELEKQLILEASSPKHRKLHDTVLRTVLMNREIQESPPLAKPWESVPEYFRIAYAHTILGFKNTELHAARLSMRWPCKPCLSFFTTLQHTLNNRRFFTTSRGLTGLGSCRTEPGDRVILFSGAEMPFIVRGETLLGEAYVDGIMNGEWFTNDGKFDHTPEMEEFTLR